MIEISSFLETKKWQVLYHGYTLLADMPIADWKRLWNFDIVVEM